MPGWRSGLVVFSAPLSQITSALLRRALTLTLKEEIGVLCTVFVCNSLPVLDLWFTEGIRISVAWLQTLKPYAVGGIATPLWQINFLTRQWHEACVLRSCLFCRLATF